MTHPSSIVHKTWWISLWKSSAVRVLDTHSCIWRSLWIRLCTSAPCLHPKVYCQKFRVNSPSGLYLGHKKWFPECDYHLLQSNPSQTILWLRYWCPRIAVYLVLRFWMHRYRKVDQLFRGCAAKIVPIQDHSPTIDCDHRPHERVTYHKIQWKFRLHFPLFHLDWTRKRTKVSLKND